MEDPGIDPGTSRMLSRPQSASKQVTVIVLVPKAAPAVM